MFAGKQLSDISPACLSSGQINVWKKLDTMCDRMPTGLIIVWRKPVTRHNVWQHAHWSDCLEETSYQTPCGRLPTGQINVWRKPANRHHPGPRAHWSD